MDKNFLKKVSKIKKKNIPFRFDHPAFYEFINRLTNKNYVDKFILRTMESKSGFDEYNLFDEDDKVIIEATSGVSAAVAFNTYLKRCCHVHFGLITDSGTLPSIPPSVGKKIHKRSLYHYRYFLNYCTFGYTFTYYSWKDWEKLIDRMMLSGYNLVLNAVGQECIWKETLLRLGYKQDDITSFLVGAPFMPWLNMMNMSSYYGAYPSSWWSNRLELANNISSRLYSFGCSSMLVGYSGMVPNDFNKYYPDATLLDQGDWCGYIRPKYLLYSDPMFDKVADVFYQTQNELLGKNKVHYYSSDPFHEGGISDGIDLAKFALKAYEALKRNDKDGIWCFQGWENNPKREMITAFPYEDSLVLNLLGDTNGNGGDNYCSRPWIYCTVNNFGGQHLLRGGLSNSLLKPYDFIHKNDYTMVGIGLMPESVENDEVFFDILAYTSINDEKPDLRTYLKQFISSRYGICNESLLKAWEILTNEVYLRDDISVSFESSFLSLPSLTTNRVSMFAKPSKDEYPLTLINVIKLLLSNYDACKSSSSYIFDLADIARQCNANYCWRLIYNMQNSYKNKDLQTFETSSKLFKILFILQDKICSCHKRLTMANYLNYPLNYDKDNKKYNTYLAKRLITVWGDKRTHYRLNDYAAREYGGLIKDFYYPRWCKFIDMMSYSLKNNTLLEEHDFYKDVENYVLIDKTFDESIRDDLDVLVNEFLSIIEKAPYKKY